MKLLHDVAPEDGNGNDSPAAENKPAAPAAPAAASIVVTGTKSEREIDLELQIEEERKVRLDRERTICEMQDKHESYRKTVEKPAPRPAAKRSHWQPLIGSDE